MKSIKSNYLFQILFIFTLFFNSLSFGQYKRMNIGVGYSTNNFSNNFSSINLSLQYNFNKHFAVRSGFEIESTSSNKLCHFGYPSNSTDFLDIKSRYVGVPILFRTVVGNKIKFFADLGGGILFWN